MSHELDFSLGRAAMAYVGETPWHGLGATLTPGADQETWIREAGLDWVAERSAVHYYDMNLELRVDDERRVMFRSDTGAPLSVISKRYQPVQPREVVGFFQDLVSLGGFTLETAGSLRGGKRIWATEFGWATTDGLGVSPATGYEYAGDNTQAQQAAWLVEAYQIGKASGYMGVMFMWNLNYNNPPGDEKSAFSLTYANNQPRPAFSALASMPK